MKYYLVAGEPSGDLHASNLITHLSRLDQDAAFRFVGGNLMQEVFPSGLYRHFSEIAHMLIWEVVIHLDKILKNIALVKDDIKRYHPDALILVDFSGFNLQMAKFAKKNGLKVFYYISPKVWAWDAKRVYKIKKWVDQMFVILPFEVPFYKKFGVEVTYVGNPIMDPIDAFRQSSAVDGSIQLEVVSVNTGILLPLGGQKIVALLPGSRYQEVTKILPFMLGVVERFPEYQFVIAGALGFPLDFYKNIVKQAMDVSEGSAPSIGWVNNQTYPLLLKSEAAIVTSGTATLETALLNVPEVVVYRTSRITIFLLRFIVKVKFISLVNLILGREAVKELLQDDCTIDAITSELKKIVSDPVNKRRILEDYDALREKVGPSGASEKTAKLIFERLHRGLV